MGKIVVYHMSLYSSPGPYQVINKCLVNIKIFPVQNVNNLEFLPRIER